MTPNNSIMKERKRGFFYYFFLGFLFNRKKQIVMEEKKEEEKSNIIVSVVYEHISARCKICDCIWEAIIETDQIDWGNGVKEVRYVEEIECPDCSTITRLNRR